jgi:hypothetical protein
LLVQPHGKLAVLLLDLALDDPNLARAMLAICARISATTCPTAVSVVRANASRRWSTCSRTHSHHGISEPARATTDVLEDPRRLRRPRRLDTIGDARVVAGLENQRVAQGLLLERFA